MFKTASYLYLLLLPFFITSCASIGNPEGGPKDIAPPKLIESNPKNGSLNVTGQKLEFIFDEDIQVKDLNRQMLITPNTTNTYKSKVDKDRIVMEFDKPLEKNTTYFINFRGAVSDLTEGNKPENLSLTFSTGTFLDSGQVNGNVRDLFTNVPEKSMNIVLYAAGDTTTIRKNKPYYLTQTDEKGRFKLQNIRLGEYRIYAHQDKNNNLIYDNENEKIAYLKNSINITSQTDSISLIALKVDTRRPLVEKTDRFTDEYRLNFNEGITAIKVTSLANPRSSAPLVPAIDKTGKVVRLYPRTALDKADYIVTATDSAKNILVDTLNINFEGKKSPRVPEVFTPKLYGGQIAKDEPLQLTFAVPIKVVRATTPLTLVQDTVDRKALSFLQDFKLDSTYTVLTVNQPLTAKQNLQIILDTTKIAPVAGDLFRSKVNKYQILSTASVGSLLGPITTNYKRYWVEILGPNRQIITVLDSPKELKLEKLEPSKYTIRVKIDENNDGTWQAGNVDLTTPAERIFHYPDVIEIRANWEIKIAAPMPPLSF